MDVKFDVEFVPSRQASVHGGQLGIHALLKEFGLQGRVAREPALDPRTHSGKAYEPMIYILQAPLTLTSGGISLADAERLNDDDALK